jgi:multisubunit Na+/H+ antiporter MnhC subunit
MNILKDVLSELFSMFVADARLTMAILLIVVITAFMIRSTNLSPLIGGLFLLLGCIAVLFFSVSREATRRLHDSRH